MTETGLCLYPWDIGDDFEQFKKDYEATGCNAVAAAVSYHHGTILSARSGKIYTIPEAMIGFAPREDLYGRLKPRVRRELAERGTVRAMRDWCGATGRHFSAWTVLLHNSTLGREHPDVCCENAFGDHYAHALCPANPDAADYAEALVRDVCTALRPDSVLLESVAAPTPFHGEHHEIMTVRPGPAALWLLSFCFCDHCRAAADAEEPGLHARARAICARVLRTLLNRETGIPGNDQMLIAALLLEHPELYRYQQARGRAAGALTRRVADAAHAEGVAVRVVPSAIPHVVTGAFHEAMNFTAQAAAKNADMLVPLVYTAGETYANVLENIRLFDPATPVGMVMTLSPSRYPGRGDFLGAVSDAARRAPACVYFYNYSIAPAERLGWVADAARIPGISS